MTPVDKNQLKQAYGINKPILERQKRRHNFFTLLIRYYTWNNFKF